MSVDSYKASICKLKLAPIPGAVTLQLAYVNGLTYAVGKRLHGGQIVPNFWSRWANFRRVRKGQRFNS